MGDSPVAGPASWWLGRRRGFHALCSPQIDQLIAHGADILNPVTLTQGDKVAVGTAVDYGYFRFFQVRLGGLLWVGVGAGALVSEKPPRAPAGLAPHRPRVTGVPGAVPQDRKIAHCPFHTLMPAEREVFLGRKRLLDHMGAQLRCAVLAKESRWDPEALYLSKRGGWPPGRAGPGGWHVRPVATRSGPEPTLGPGRRTEPPGGGGRRVWGRAP